MAGFPPIQTFVNHHLWRHCISVFQPDSFFLICKQEKRPKRKQPSGCCLSFKNDPRRLPNCSKVKLPTDCPTTSSYHMILLFIPQFSWILLVQPPRLSRQQLSFRKKCWLHPVTGPPVAPPTRCPFSESLHARHFVEFSPGKWQSFNVDGPSSQKFPGWLSGDEGWLSQAYEISCEKDGKCCRFLVIVCKYTLVYQKP